MKKQKRKKRKSNTGRISILCIGIFLIMVFSIQMVRLYQKNQEYVKQEQALNEQVKDLKKEMENNRFEKLWGKESDYTQGL